MKRALAIVLVLSSLASAQPAKKPPPKPVDPYGDPVIGPAPPPGGIKPPTKTDNPYGTTKPAAPPVAPPPKPPDPKTSPYAKPGPVKPADPYARVPSAPIDPYAVPARVGIGDFAAVQGLLAVQRLDGWLLYDRDGANPIARRLVAPDGNPTRPWFYLIPAKGQPIALVHDAEKRSFDALAGTKLTYTGYRDLEAQLRVLLKGMRTVAVEYSPRAAVPAVSRVDAGTLELIRAAGVQVRSSDTLVQYTKAIWGDAGRALHQVAVDHLVALRKEVLAAVVKQLAMGAKVTEYDVQQRLARGLIRRGLVGPAPGVAAGANTADPYYVPTAARTAEIHRGDLIVLSLAARVDKPDGIYAAQTWVAVVDREVRDDYKTAFAAVTGAREAAIALIRDRIGKGKGVTGAEVDQAARASFKKANVADKVKHRTGHSIDSDLSGSGADLDDFETKDSRTLTPGTGFTIGPGIYVAGSFGVRTEVSVFLTPTGPEVTTPPQDFIEPLLQR